MNDIARYKKLDRIYESDDTVVYRGLRTLDSTPVILKILKTRYPTFQEISNLKQEYEIAKVLDLTGTIKTYGLEKFENQLTLILEDFGGQALNEFLGQQPLKALDFLKIAIQLAEIVGQLHEHHIIHKDIKPQNIIIHPLTKAVKLSDFSIASRLNREHQAIANPNALQGTLAYMSPEQTGRMNRAIDYRSDFYSLGVTFYQMLTGQLPFIANDPLELIHSHIARKPVPPHELNPEVPQGISDIVVKLLAKTAEERYQSDQGLKVDLEVCHHQLIYFGEITNFQAGKQDKSSRFSIPQKLYGRENEVAKLLSIFERTCAGNVELVTVSGYSGIGKTRVINEIHKPIVQSRGYFIEGKFDQLKRNIPYTAIVSAFSDLVRQILTETQGQVEDWKAELLEALGPNAQVIIELIPEVELIVGKQPPVPPLPPTETQNRFNRVFQQFLQVFTKPDHPLVLFLDDLQWVDAASLNLLELLITDPDTQYLLTLVAYRDNEVDATHPLMTLLAELHTVGTVVHQFSLHNLDGFHVQQLLADTLREEQNRVKSLADLLFNKTQGNPFFLTQLLQSLYDDKFLTFDYEEGLWQWDIEQIQSRGITDLNVVELMTRNIQKLSPPTQAVLKVAACIGNRFNLDVLAIALEQSESITAAQLWKALQVGLILPISGGSQMALAMGDRTEDGELTHDWEMLNPQEAHRASESITYKFLHDRVQQAAYALIPEEQRNITHLKLGQQLLQKIGPDEIEANIFDIVNQLNRGVAFIGVDRSKQSESFLEEAIDPLELARLNLIAGHKAKEAAAYETAAEYLTFGITLLGENSWEDEYELTLDLHIEAAEAEYLKTHYEAATLLGNKVLQHTTSVLDRVKVYEVQIQLALGQSQLTKALEIGLQALGELGVCLFPLPTDGNWRIEMPQLEDLDQYPVLSDPQQLAGLRLLMTLAPCAYLTRPDLVAQLVLTEVNICIELGHSELAAFAYAGYGMLLCGMAGDIDGGYHSGQLALQLLEQFPFKSHECKIYQTFNGFIRPWKEPLRESMSKLAQGIQSGLETGDLVFSGNCIITYCSNLLWLAEPLEGVNRQQSQYFSLLEKLKQDYPIYYLKIWNQFTLNLLGQSENPCHLKGERFDEEILIPVFEETQNHTLLFMAYLAKTILNYLLNQSKTAVQNATVASVYSGAVMGLILVPLHNFYSSLAMLAEYPLAQPSDREKYLHQVEENQQKMQHWAAHAPANFQHKYELVEAEKARVLGHLVEAMERYDCAIASARDAEYIQEEAIASERAAEFYFSLGRFKVARVYLMDAYAGYLRWGAMAKVTDLELRYPDILSQKRVRDLLNTTGTHTTTSTTGLTPSTLDLATVMKASQALADEIVLDQLLEKLLKIVMESAGAQTSCFILEKEGIFQVEAVGTVDPMEVRLYSNDPVITGDHIPISLLNYVVRTRETVVVSNAAKGGRFTRDSYVRQNQTKSLLCAPIINQSNLIGLLYLENNQVIDAFTSDRVEILKLLCSQIAISIKNALLYANLEAATTQLTAAKERLEEYSHTLEAKVENRTLELQAKNQDLQQTLQKLRQTQAQLIQTEKMSSLGQLVAGVAHEINNPVNFIYGNLIHSGEYLHDCMALLELYEQTYPEPTPEIEDLVQEIELEFLKDDFPRMLRSMQVGAERIRQIVRSLRNFSRLDEADIKEVDINEGIESTLEILQHRFKQKPGSQAIALVKAYGTLPLVACYAGQLNQVFMNLLSNAIDSLEEKARRESPQLASTVGSGLAATEVSTALLTAPPPDPQIQIRTEVEGDFVVIRIADNGTGMTQEVRSKLFDPFFTTKPVGSGTGLGLSISYQIVVEKHGGYLECESILGEGSEFAITIPIKLSHS